jgi:SAM-dependent methyltransferase
MPRDFPNNEIDAYVEQYDESLEQGLSVSGEGREYFLGKRILWLKEQLDGLGERPTGVLDFGCGDGAASELLIEYLGAQSILGIDSSAKTIALARKKHDYKNTQFVLTDDYSPSEAIDCVYSNGVFHHIPPLERHEAIQYINRCLRPGGIFALWENNPWNPGTRYVMSRIPFDRDAILVMPQEAKTLCKSGGFEIISMQFLFIFPRALSSLRWIEPLVCRVPFGAQYLVLGRKVARV